MRKLGRGQSVIFFAPWEVDRRIREAARKCADDQIEVVDILRWTMLETCAEVTRYALHWAQQGMDYERRQKAWKELSCSTNANIEGLKSSWLQPEAHTLEDMYGPLSSDKSIHHVLHEFPDILERCERIGVSSFSHQQMEEEQEREVNQEIEREQQVERPPPAKAAEHRVHDHVRDFVQTGVIKHGSPGFVPTVFPTRMSHGNEWSPYLIATKDFSITI